MPSPSGRVCISARVPQGNQVVACRFVFFSVRRCPTSRLRFQAGRQQQARMAVGVRLCSCV